MVSAFVMTQSLLREIQRSGTVSLARFYRNLLFRMAPLAWAVIAGTMLAALLLLPITQWSTIGEQATSAALFQINYFLGFESIAYLGEAANSSLFQHFWAMSVQVQFYLVFPLFGWLLAAVIRATRIPRTPLLLCAFSVILAASLTYATASIIENQAFAYFDTGARAWEFAAGALVAIALPHVRLPRSARLVLAATGLVVLVSFGAFLDATTLFPGPAALVPVVAAVAILVGGASGATHGASKLLASRPLVAAAEYSFGFYLWHWPVLVMHRQLTEQELLGPVDGLGVIAISAALAYLTHRLIEVPVRGAARQAKTPREWRRPIARLAVVALVPFWRSEVQGRTWTGCSLPRPSIIPAQRY
ncbi:hypothetical protein GCM10025874_12760 [Arenivirga flava]|uniref:Acyltransferase 3 domain-containing protein n=1 Tax=Arenivirga flava TaxID=1930060 RepID=A0AA37UBV9_9MICO|nr:hypothetical protein GCM10025874_12760 [Arenivirga flava]